MSKKVDLGNLYRNLYDAYCAAYADSKNKQTLQEEVNKLWKSFKTAGSVEDKVNSKIQELKVILMKKKGALMGFFSKIQSKPLPGQLQVPKEIKVSLTYFIATVLFFF